MTVTTRTLLSIILYSWVSCSTLASTAMPVITLSHGGRVRGQTETVVVKNAAKRVDYFYGIPFGKPPTDELRFAPPEPHPGWRGVMETTRLPYSCWQFIFSGFDLANPGARMWVNNTEMNEDCLYLNVWKPAGSEGKGLPVIVWIYGGGYTTGTANLDVYNGKFLSAQHDIIVVSMQYRLGPFGFLRLEPEPYRDRERGRKRDHLALGNMALKDQLLALQWVNQEIEKFGGDPNKVTIFGESSGGVSVSALWVSPKAQSLFTRAIVHSGTVLNRWGLHDLDMAHHRSAVFTDACNCSRSSRDEKLECLLNVEPINLMNCLNQIYDDIAVQRNETMWNNFFHAIPKSEFGNDPYPGLASSSYRYFDVPLSVVIDGDFMPMHPNDIIQNASMIKQSPELIIGVNQDESIYFLLYGLGIENATFLLPNGTIQLPESIRKAGLRQPLKSDGQVADFHWITALQILEQKYLLPGVSKLPAQFYGLPMATNSSYYFGDVNEAKLSPEEVMKRVNDLASDVDFVCPTLDFADRVARLPGAKVYLYFFTEPSAKLPWPHWTGVMHGYELHYVFGMPHSKEFTENFFGFTSEEKEFGDRMQQLWVNFAKTGNPTRREDGTAEQIFWPVYRPTPQKNPNELDHLIVNQQMKAGSSLRERECAFWLHLMEDQRQIVAKLIGSAPMILANRIMSTLFPLFVLRIIWN